MSCEAVSAPAFLLLCLVVLVACGGGSDSIATSSETEPRTSSTLEELWRAPGDDVAVVPGTSTYEPGRVRVSFLVVNAEGQPVLLPTARVWLARGLEE